MTIILASPLLAVAQTGAKRQTPRPVLPTEDRLRIRLQLYPQDAAAHKQLAELLRKKGAFRAFVAEEATWIKNNPGDYVALTELVTYAKVALHDPEFAIAQQRSFLAHTARSDDAWSYDGAMETLASDLNKRGRAQEGLKVFDEVIRLNPEEAGFWADRSDALLSLGRTEEAIESLRHALALDPSQEYVHEALADALVKAGDLSGAEAEYQAALSVYRSKYKAGETTNSFDSMIKDLVKIEAANHAEHGLAKTNLKLARVLMLEKNWDAAIAETQAALDADQTGFEAYYARAQIYDAAGNRALANHTREAARTAIEKLSKDTPRSAELGDPRVPVLAEGALDSDSNVMAFPWEIVSILVPRLESLSAMERFMLASAYLDLGRVPEAKQQWEKAVSSEPKLDNAVAHTGFGQKLLKTGATRDALPHLRRAYELDPQNSTYRMDYEAAKRQVEHKTQ